MGEAAFCTKCGNPTRDDSTYCTKCGAQIGANGSSSSITSQRPASGKRRRRVWYLIGIVLVVGIIALSVYFYEDQPGNALNPYKVRVSEVIWTTNGNSLGSTPGFTVKAGSPHTVSITLSCSPSIFGPNTCYSGSVYIVTNGFGLLNTNAPLTWSSGSNGSTATVFVELTTPSYAYSGNLNIDLH